MAITKEKTKELVDSHGKNSEDTGSTESQIAIFTERVKNLREHAKTLKQSGFPITNEEVYYENISPHIGNW